MSARTPDEFSATYQSSRVAEAVKIYQELSRQYLDMLRERDEQRQRVEAAEAQVTALQQAQERLKERVIAVVLREVRKSPARYRSDSWYLSNVLADAFDEAALTDPSPLQEPTDA